MPLGSTTRRRLLRTLGAGSMVGLSGCSESAAPSESTTAPSTETVQSTPTAQSTPWNVDPVEHDKLVGAFYYAWYWSEDGYAIFRDRPWLDHSPYTPVLGQYDSRDPAVVDQHIAWALESGVNWFVINTGHPGGPIMTAIEESFLGADLSDRINYSFDIGFDHGPVTAEDGRYVVDHPENLVEYERYFDAYADFFDDPNYVRFDGRPVLFDFSTPSLTGDVVAGLDAVKDSIDEDPYIIANPTGFWTPPAIQPRNRMSSETMFEAYDGVRKYAALPPSGADEVRENYPAYWAAQTEYWRFLSERHDVGFIPTVMPGMNDREIDWDRVHHEVFDLSTAEFRTVCDRSLDYVDPDLDAVVVTSWNEFPEGTSIEPAEEYGHGRLDVVREELGETRADPISVAAYVPVELDFDRTVRPEGAPASMQLAFFLEGIELVGEDETIRSYNVGAVGHEPTFVEGAYNRGTHGEHTGRWLGGPTGKAVLYVHPDGADAVAAVVSGRPISPGEIEADVSVDGVRTDRVAFDTAGDAEYRVSLSPR